MVRVPRGTSAPATLATPQAYTLLTDPSSEPPVNRLTELTSRHTLHDDAGLATRQNLSEEALWSFRNTIAFWAATFFLQGSVLFTIGSVAMYPSVLIVCGEEGTKEENMSSGCQPEYFYRAWVDYSFMIGAWCFTIGNYCVYFQVINSHDSSDKRCRYISLPVKEWGHIGALSNLLGAFAFNVNTLLMYDNNPHDSIWYDYNLVYVISGGIGSILFAAGAWCEGEHNQWRGGNLCALKKPEVLMAVLNFIASLLFLLAYIVEYNHYANHHLDVLVFLVATPFTVGSIFFFIGSWMSLVLWKQQNFGLGYAKHIFGKSHVVVDWTQQLMGIVYIGCICMQWERLGNMCSYNWGYYHNVYLLEITFRLLLYHCIMFLMSALHTTPNRHPFGIMLFGMRFIAVYAFFGDAYLLRKESMDPDAYSV